MLLKQILILLLVFLFGCGANIQSISHYSKSLPERKADHADCQKVSGYTGGGGFVFGPLIIVAAIVAVASAVNASAKNSYIKCMRDRGYNVQLEDVGEVESGIN